MIKEVVFKNVVKEWYFTVRKSSPLLETRVDKLIQKIEHDEKIRKHLLISGMLKDLEELYNSCVKGGEVDASKCFTFLDYIHLFVFGRGLSELEGSYVHVYKASGRNLYMIEITDREEDRKTVHIVEIDGEVNEEELYNFVKEKVKQFFEEEFGESVIPYGYRELRELAEKVMTKIRELQK